MRNQIDETVLSALYELLSQDQFELIEPVESDRIRLVYLMNDAVESFFVFEQARLTGSYDPAYGGELEAEVSVQEDDRYMLTVRQSAAVCTIFFRDLTLEVHLYNYGKTGHVWMQGHEELRQIEYWAAITKAKLEYLGEDSCTGREKRLARLEEFPPLNCCCYPAVPRQYFEPREDAWQPTQRGLDAVEYFARKAGDTAFLRRLNHYRQHPTVRSARHLAAALQQNRHSKTVEAVMREFLEASAVYPDRVFEQGEEAAFSAVKDRAAQRCRQLESEGHTVYTIFQEPFVMARDDVEYKAHLLILDPGIRNRKVRVETFTLQDPS